MKKLVYAVILGVSIMNLPAPAWAAAPIAPSITTQPSSQSVACGSTVQFSVVAAGSPPLSYSWTANGFPVSDATTNATLTVTNVTADRLIQVRVVVTNAFGAVASEPATLTITNQSPVGMTIIRTNITDQVYGVAWPNDACVPSDLLSVSYAIPNQTNWSAVIATNAIVTSTSNIVEIAPVGIEALYVLAHHPPTILSSLSAQSLTSTIGSNVTFTVNATNGPPTENYPLFYDWRLNGIRLAGATNSTLTLPNVQRADGGSYSVVVGNGVDDVSSDIAILKVGGTGIVLSDNFASRMVVNNPTNAVNGNNIGATKEPLEPLHAGVLGGKSVWLAWTAISNGIVTFDTKGSTFDTVLAVYTNTNLSSLVLVASDDDQGGSRTSQVQFNAVAGTEYEIAIDGFGGNSGDISLSWKLEVTSDQIPVIVTQPQSQTVQVGTNSIPFIVITAPSALPLTYQWRFNGTALPGATNRGLTVSDAQFANLGAYTVVVSNGARSVESTPALLDLEERKGTFLLSPPDPERQFKDKLEVEPDSPVIQILTLNDSEANGGPVKIILPPAGGSTTLTTSYGLSPGGAGILCGQSVGGTLYASVQTPKTGTGTVSFSLSGGIMMQVFKPDWSSTPCASSYISCAVPYPGSYYSVTIGASGPGASSGVRLSVSMN
jgi:hypothetical protein